MRRVDTIRYSERRNDAMQLASSLPPTLKGFPALELPQARLSVSLERKFSEQMNRTPRCAIYYPQNRSISFSHESAVFLLFSFLFFFFFIFGRAAQRGFWRPKEVTERRTLFYSSSHSRVRVYTRRIERAKKRAGERGRYKER